LERNEKIKENDWCQYLMRYMPFEEFLDAMTKGNSFRDFAKRLGQRVSGKMMPDILSTLQNNDLARRDFNQIRELLGLKPLRLSKAELPESEGPSGSSKPSDERRKE
ncbi:MAG TPA: hypothetical protein VIK39_18190, partial [Candidatus Angelobacter sp.]